MHHFKEIFRLTPARNDHHPAIRTAVGVGVPLLVLVLAGRIDLTIFASFGAFTGIYGRNQPHRQRLVHQAKASLLLLLFIFAGAVCAHAGIGPWGIVIGTTLVAGLGTLGTGFGRLQPAGSLFHIFAFGAISSVPSQPPVWQGMLAAALTVAFALAVAVSSRVHPGHRSPWTRPLAEPFTPGERKAILLDAVRYTTAAGVAGSIAVLLGIGHSYWAMVAAVVPLAGPTVTHRLGRALNRILGTTAGLGLTWVILLGELPPWALVLVIAVLQFLAESFIARQYTIAQTFVTPLALVSTELAHPSGPLPLIQDRAIETLIGALVGVLVVLAASGRDRTAGRPRVR
ncbi:FUSC family protein [Arthrobacter sp. PAMC25564]|nr:FUSC family protein [Arthrobacter sp. PAMC25564]